MSAGYFLVDNVWLDEEARARYVQAVGDTVDEYGGEFVASGPDHETLEGDWRFAARAPQSVRPYEDHLLRGRLTIPAGAGQRERPRGAAGAADAAGAAGRTAAIAPAIRR